jgi:hypothetical protein
MAGIDDPHVLDLVTHDPRSGEYALIISAPGPWDEDSAMRAENLSAKLTNYIDFAVSGRFVASYPEAAGKRLRIQIDCTSPLGSAANLVVERMRTVAEANGIRLLVHRL